MEFVRYTLFIYGLSVIVRSKNESQPPADRNVLCILCLVLFFVAAAAKFRPRAHEIYLHALYIMRTGIIFRN